MYLSLRTKQLNRHVLNLCLKTDSVSSYCLMKRVLGTSFVCHHPINTKIHNLHIEKHGLAVMQIKWGRDVHSKYLLNDSNHLLVMKNVVRCKHFGTNKKAMVIGKKIFLSQIVWSNASTFLVLMWKYKLLHSKKNYYKVKPTKFIYCITVNI